MNTKRLGPADIARRWGVNRATVIRLIEEQKLPALAVRKTATRTTYRVKLADVEAYEEEQSTVKGEPSSTCDEADHLALAEVASS